MAASAKEFEEGPQTLSLAAERGGCITAIGESREPAPDIGGRHLRRIERGGGGGEKPGELFKVAAVGLDSVV